MSIRMDEGWARLGQTVPGWADEARLNMVRPSWTGHANDVTGLARGWWRGLQRAVIEDAPGKPVD